MLGTARVTQSRQGFGRLRACPGALAPALLVGFLAAVLAGAGFLAQGAEQGTTQPSSPAGPATPERSAPAIIPVEQIAPRATEVASLLRNVAGDLIPGDKIEAIGRSLPSFSATTARELASTMRLVDEQPSLETLQTLDQAWLERQTRSTAWLNLLTEGATRLQDALDRLQGLQETWTRTRNSEQSAKAPAPVLQQIDGTLAAIEAAQPPILVQRDEILDLQGQVAAEVVRCETARTQIGRLQRAAVGGIFTQDGEPIWSPGAWSRALTALPARASQILAAYWAEVLEYVRDPSKRMPVHLGLFLLALIALLAARGQVDQWAAAGQDVSRVTAAFNHPFAAALLLALMAATAYTSPAPLAVKQLLSALALAPMIIVARPVVSAPLVPVLYTLGVLFALDTLRHAFGGHPPSLARSSSFRSRLSALSYWLGCCAAEGCREQAAMPQTRANGCCGGSSPA